jgi:hypothetical protein
MPISLSLLLAGMATLNLYSSLRPDALEHFSYFSYFFVAKLVLLDMRKKFDSSSRQGSMEQAYPSYKVQG